MMRVASESENEAGLSWDVKYGRLPPSIHTLKTINKRTCHKDDQILVFLTLKFKLPLVLLCSPLDLSLTVFLFFYLVLGVSLR